jgi:autotransporter-associated beta strand protein
MTFRKIAGTWLAVLSLLPVIASRQAMAVTHTWTGGAFSNSMNVSGNWTGGTPVSSSSNLTLIFPSSASVFNLNQDIANPLVVQSMQIDLNNYSINGNTIRMSNLGAAPTIDFTGSGFGGVSIGAPLNFNAPTMINRPGAGFNSVNFDNLSGTDVTFDAASTTNYVLGGATANNLTGAYLVKGSSRLILQKPVNTVAIGGSVTVDGPNALVIVQASQSNQIAAGTDLTAINSGQVDLNGTNQTVDNLAIESSAVAFSFNTGTTLTVTGQISSSTGVGTLGFGTGAMDIDFAGQFKTVNITSTGAGDKLRIADRITNGSINKIGAGKLEVSNTNNAFTGTNVVAAGTLAGGPQSIGTVTNNDTVELNTFGNLVANQITGPGQVNIVNAGIGYSGAQNYSGGTFLMNGSVTGEAATLLGNFVGVSNGSVNFSQPANATWSGALSGSASLSQFGPAVLSLGGNNPYTNGTFISNGGINILSDTAVGTGQINIFGDIQATGTRTLSNVLLPGSSTFVGSGNFIFTDTTTKQPFGATTHNSTGTTDIAGKWSNGGTTITVNAGQLAIGDPNVVNGFTSNGPIVVNGGTLTVRSLNFITLPDVTLAGGTLNAPNGYAIPLGAVLQGMGGVTGRVASANGSSILASGNLTIGDAAHAAGVNLDGELYTDQFAVTLSDANQAVVGSLTHLGDGTNNGTLNAPNGIVVNFGRNVTGRGQINSNNALVDAVIMNGDVNGDSNVNYLEFTGYVKGVGTFNNVAFSGTFAPGLSPAVVDVGNAILTPTSVLEMEIGGQQRGSEYDSFDIAGTMILGGDMKITLLNGFSPEAGDQWQLFDGVTTGGFDRYVFPTIGDDLMWDTSALYSTGMLAVVPGLAGDFNGDGSVDAADYLTWRRQLGTTRSQADYAVWRANFGRAGGVGASLAAVVPEPAMEALLLSGILGAVLCRRRF